MKRLSSILSLLATVPIASSGSPLHPAPQAVVQAASPHEPISLQLFYELEELSRIVDIAYCVGTTGISEPFSCASRCSEFPSLELVSTFNTGPLMSDSCGYVALDHGTGPNARGRILVAFRGTYSITNTIVDLSTVPQEYVPYPGNSTKSSHGPRRGFLDWMYALVSPTAEIPLTSDRECMNCSVHTGFWTSWQNTRPFVLPHLERLRKDFPAYELHIVGHSLGGAVAALAALELKARGWTTTVTTFGEPRVGNAGLRDFINQVFELVDDEGRPQLREGRFRRVTHYNDPVPLLPLEEWGYVPHAGEVYIAKGKLQPSPSDVFLCLGNEDPECLAASANSTAWFSAADLDDIETADVPSDEDIDDDMLHARWGLSIPARYRIWQLFFAHRDYFWRLGLCVPGGDPFDWGRDRYGSDEGDSSSARASWREFTAQRAAERAREL
jgi:pimeloyl-ACP methyl ester carboxylesterase